MKKKTLFAFLFGAFVSFVGTEAYLTHQKKQEPHFTVHKVPKKFPASSNQEMHVAHHHYHVPKAVLWAFGIMGMMILIGMMQMDQYLKGSIIEAGDQKKIIDIADAYVAAESPYVWGAPIPCAVEDGCDCSSFTGTVIQQAINYELPRISRDQATIGETVALHEVRVGDLLFFNTGGAAGDTQHISHVGLAVEILPGGDIIMANATSYPEPGKIQRDKIKVSTQSGYWYGAFIKAQRINNLTKYTVADPVHVKEDFSDNMTDIPASEPSPEQTNKIFKDIDEGNPYYTAIKYAADENIINSGSNVDFRPWGTLSRAEAVKIISEALNFPKSSSIDKHFPDVASKNHWVGNYLASFRNKNILNGYADGNFGVDDPLTAEQLMKILSVAFNLPSRSGTYADIPQGHWAEQYAGVFMAYDLFPADNGKIGFEQPITREKTIETLYRVMKYKNKL